MQNFAEHKPRGVAKSCPTYRAAGQNEIASGGTHHDSLRQRDNPGPDLVKISIREMENEYSSTCGRYEGSKLAWEDTRARRGSGGSPRFFSGQMGTKTPSILRKIPLEVRHTRALIRHNKLARGVLLGRCAAVTLYFFLFASLT